MFPHIEASIGNHLFLIMFLTASLIVKKLRLFFYSGNSSLNRFSIICVYSVALLSTMYSSSQNDFCIFLYKIAFQLLGFPYSSIMFLKVVESRNYLPMRNSINMFSLCFRYRLLDRLVFFVL
jgi:hypothetical protein